VGDLGNVDRGRVTALIANVYGIGWRVLLPLSGAFELSALVMFLRAVSAHRVQPGEKADQRWVLIVLAGTLGLVAVLGMNLFEGVRHSQTQFMVVPKNSMVKQYAGYPGIVISSGRSL